MSIELKLEKEDLELLMLLCFDIDPKEYNDESLLRANKLGDKFRELVMKS